MAEEEKGFIIKDKRTFSSGTEALDEEKEQAAGKEEEPEKEPVASEEETASEEDVQFPEVSFSTFVFSISSSVLLHFGEIPDPATGEKKKNLPMAKHSVDILSMLEEKTRGNLTDEEEQLITNILYDLRMRYVKETQ
ncbi:MAG: DUF1844 domain-containing protein [Deltaproteobacteria bacterium]|nr:DUF1844 domain-containing protein [Deltaproteobacteria bacterium]